MGTEGRLALRNLLLGLGCWAVPYLASQLLYRPGGTLAVHPDLLKSSLIALTGVSSPLFLYLYFRPVPGNYVRHSLVVGLSWLALNLFMDSLTAWPRTGLPFSAYAVAFGARYAMIVCMSITMGVLLQRKAANGESGA